MSEAVSQSPVMQPDESRSTAAEIPHDLEELIRDATVLALDRALKLDKTPGWVQCKQRIPKDAPKDCCIFTRPKGKLTVVRASCTMKGSPEQILSTLQHGDGKTSNTTSTKLSAECTLPDTLSLWHTAVKIPIVKDRDFVICQSLVEDPVYALVGTSVPTELGDSLVAQIKSFKRGNVLLQATIVQPTDVLGETVVMTIACVDPAGSIGSAKTMAAKGAISALSKLQRTVAGAFPNSEAESGEHKYLEIWTQIEKVEEDPANGLEGTEAEVASLNSSAVDSVADSKESCLANCQGTTSELQHASSQPPSPAISPMQPPMQPASEDETSEPQ